MKVNDKHLALLCQDQQCDKAGYVYKRGVFFNTEFKKRWFVLKGNLLFYFKSKAGLTDPTGVIFLEDATVDINPIVSQPNFYYEFTVNFHCGNDHRSYQLATKTKEATDEWVQAIRVAGFSNLKEKLDAIQMELFKAEFCFGIEQVAPEDEAAAAAAAAATAGPADPAAMPAISSLSVKESDSRATENDFMEDQDDSSGDEEHYRNLSTSTLTGSPDRQARVSMEYAGFAEDANQNRKPVGSTELMEKATAAISFRTMLKEVETEQQGAEAALDAGSALNNTATPQPPHRKKLLQRPGQSGAPINPNVFGGPATANTAAAAAVPAPPQRHPSRKLNVNPNNTARPAEASGQLT
jgi:hypothetical protein